jgi:glycosyltransferase involved in cell wall biosynthesis
MNNEELKQELITAGIKQAAKFSWKAMAEDVLKIYAEVQQNNTLKN